jgi:hypothetical protein
MKTKMGAFVSCGSRRCHKEQAHKGESNPPLRGDAGTVGTLPLGKRIQS